MTFFTMKDFIAAILVIWTLTLGGYLYSSGAFSGQNETLNGFTVGENTDVKKTKVSKAGLESDFIKYAK